MRASATNGAVNVQAVRRGTLGCFVIGFVRRDVGDVRDTVESAHIAWMDTGACSAI